MKPCHGVHEKVSMCRLNMTYANKDDSIYTSCTSGTEIQGQRYIQGQSIMFPSPRTQKHIVSYLQHKFYTVCLLEHLMMKQSS